MKESTLNVVLAAVVLAVAVAVVLVLLFRTAQSGAGLDAGWAGFLVFVFGFVLRRAFPSASKENGEGESETHEDDRIP